MRWPFINKARVLKKWLNSNSWLFHWCHTKTWSLNLDWMYNENHILFCIFLSNIWYTYLFDALRLCWECVKRRRGWGQCRLWDMEYCLQYEKINLCLVRSITKLLTNSIWPYIISSVDIIRIWLKVSKIWPNIWPILPKNLTKIWLFSDLFYSKSDQTKLLFGQQSSLCQWIFNTFLKNF